MEIILDVQGFQQPNVKFIPKELGVINIRADEDGRWGIGCFLFKPPCSWSSLSPQYKAINSWLTKNHHGIPWDAGNMYYTSVEKVLKKIVEDTSCIYVKGLEKKLWVQSILGDSKPIINLEDLGCICLRELKTEVWGCCHNQSHVKLPRYNCAFENVQRLKRWYLNYCETVQ